MNKLFERHFAVVKEGIWSVGAAVDLAQTKTQEHHAEEVRERRGMRGWERRGGVRGVQGGEGSAAVRNGNMASRSVHVK